jgi:hypothetical protein
MMDGICSMREEKRHYCLVRISDGKGKLWEGKVDERIILKWISKK